MVRKKKLALSLVVASAVAVSLVLVNRMKDKGAAEQAHVQGDKLKGVQQQIASLADDQIEKEIHDLEAKMRADNLIGRLKQDQVTKEERKAANDVLLRMALLNVEKTRRAKGKQAE